MYPEFRQRLARLCGGRPWKGLLLALVIGLVFGVAQVGEPLENAMQVARNKLRSHPASGQIVLVAIDDRSLSELGQAPWDGIRMADLVRRIDAAGARRIHIDTEFKTDDTPRATAQLEAALRDVRGEVLLPARFSIDPVSGVRTDHTPPAQLARHATLVNANLFVWWDDAVWLHPYGARVAGRRLPSLASQLDGAHSNSAMFPIDYAIDLRTIPVVSASDLLSGRAALGQLAGKDVVVGDTGFETAHHRAPGFGPAPNIMFHLVAAETLLAGHPVNLGWSIPFVFAIGLAAAVLRARRRSWTLAILFTAHCGLLAGPVLLEAKQVHAEVLPALAMILTAALVRTGATLRRSYNSRGTTNMLTGMPNLQALRQSSETDGGIVVAALIKNYSQITSTLPPEHERELVEQIVGRLKFGTGGSVTYQAGEGIFVWVVDRRLEEGIIQQLEALQALFRSPIVIATRLIDLTVTFGLDLDGSRPLVQRVSSALVAADEAARDGRRWASFDPASLKDAEWAMSLLTRLDHAIDNGELWVAYQPKLDCRTGQLTGAEALVRWTHPEKGQVYPDQFIGAAEQGGRIERLTYFVLDTALAAAASINAGGRHFTVAVNLSVLLLKNQDLVANVESLLKKHRLAPDLLTLEVTETSTLGSAADEIANLQRLSDLGVHLSIDDYGTGFSTLEYLKRIPASEIKIDRSFVSMLNKSLSDRIMVNSTIQLAHSLGRSVVAEGVENEEILEELKRMRCDVVQGYHTGRPVPLPALTDLLGAKEAKRAA